MLNNWWLYQMTFPRNEEVHAVILFLRIFSLFITESIENYIQVAIIRSSKENDSLLCGIFFSYSFSRALRILVGHSHWVPRTPEHWQQTPKGSQPLLKQSLLPLWSYWGGFDFPREHVLMTHLHVHHRHMCPEMVGKHGFLSTVNIVRDLPKSLHTACIVQGALPDALGVPERSQIVHDHREFTAQSGVAMADAS